jgi:hypothetical protein
VRYDTPHDTNPIGGSLDRIEPDKTELDASGGCVATLAHRDMTIRVVVSIDDTSKRFRAATTLIAGASAGREVKLNWPDQLFGTLDEALQHGLQVGLDTLDTITDFGSSSEFE